VKDKQNIERDTVKTASLVLAVVFVGIVLVNVVSYYLNLQIGEQQAACQNLSDRIRSRAINVNLLFTEIIGGASDKDLNEVWILIDKIGDDLALIDEEQTRNAVNDKLLNFKGVILQLNTVFTDPAKRHELKDHQMAYYKIYGELNEEIAKVDPVLKRASGQKITLLKTFYVLAGIVIIFLLVFAGWQVRSFVLTISMMEESNRQKNKVLSAIINSTDSILIFTNNEQNVVLCNNAAEKYFGFSLPSIEGKNINEILPFMASYVTNYYMCLQMEKTEEIRSVRIPVGSAEKTVDIKMFPAGAMGEVLISIEDVTVAEAGRGQIEKAKQLEAIRNMMKGLAADFKNVFSQLSNTIATIESSVELPDDDEGRAVRNDFVLIKSAAEKVQDKVYKLVSITKEKEFHPLKVDLNVIVAKVLNVCQDICYEKKIQINHILYDVSAYTVADPDFLETVLFNITENAADALTIMKPEGQPQGGIIEVSLEKLFPDRNYRQIHPLAVASSYWVINIADNGVGMDATTCARIFDPFFTSKTQFGAIGTGLCSADEIIRRHKGFIEVYSVLGEGTSFSIFIPEIIG
jgi:nitrogen-specific signal transduction histidine kinase